MNSLTYTLSKLFNSWLGSQLRHVVTWAAGLFAWLAQNDLLTAAEAAKAAEDLNNAAANLTALVVVVAVRLAMMGIAKLFPAPVVGREGRNRVGPVAGVVLALCVSLPTLAALATLTLTSCATEHGTATPGWWAASSPIDRDARFGLLLEAQVPGLNGPEGDAPPVVEVRGEK